MRPQSILGFIIWMTATVNASTGLPVMYKIGILMETGTSPVNTALRYELDRHNNSTQWKFKFGLSIKGQGGLSNSYDITKRLCRTLDDGVLIVYGMTDTSTINVIESYVETMKMPFVTPSAPHKISQSSPNSYIIYMRPFYGGAVVDIVKHYKWSKVYYIYDSEAGLLRLQDMYDHSSRSDNGVVIDAQRLTVVSHAYDILRHIDEQSEDKDKYIILDLSSEKSLQTVLRQVQNLGMNRAKYHYLLGTLAMDELDLRDFKYGGVNITGFRLIDTNNSRAIKAEQIWRKLNASGANGKLQLNVALTIDSIAVLESAMERLPAPLTRRGNLQTCPCKEGEGCEHGEGLLSKLKEVDINGVTGRVAFDRHGHRTMYKLDIMEMSYNTDPKKIGTWDAEKGVKMNKRDDQGTNGVPKEGNKTRIVTSILVKPYLMLKDKPEDGKPLLGNDMYEGYCADLVREVAKIVGFDYVIKPVADGAYGAKQEDNTWNGMVGELTTEKADLAVAPLTIASSRERVIDFSKPFMSLGISIMIKKPEKQKPGVFSFMDPLSNEIWACIIVSFVAVSLVLFLVSRFSPYEWQIEDSVNGPTFTNDFTILNSLWFSLAAFMRQGCDISPRSLSGRIVGSVWWFFTLIIISSYTANLAAFLTVERMLTPIESVDDLAKQTEIAYGTVNNGSTKEFFKSSQISVYVKMWQFMSSNPGVFVDTVQEGVDKVRTMKGKYAFLLESTMNDYYNQRKPCNTMKVGSNLDSKGYGIATPLKSDLRDPINLAVLQLRENGELQKLKKTWWYDKGECAVDAQGKDSKQSSLSLSNVAGIFYILIGGLGMSMVVSLLEFMYKSKTEGRRRRAMFRPASRVGESLTFQPGPVGENGGVGYTDGADQYKALSTVPIARSSAVSLV